MFAFLMATLSVNAQSNKIGYAYDEAGNRVKRELVIPRSAKSPSKSPSSGKSYYDSFGDRIVKIVPNETGIVKVSVQNMQPADNGDVAVYSLKGTEVLRQALSVAEALVDISENPKGVYILKVTVNGKTTAWKITKK